MRILAACTGGAGHSGPMVPFLKACEREGVELLVAAPEGFKTRGFPRADLPDTPPEVLGPIFGSLHSLPREEANTRVLRDVFGGANVDATLATHQRLVDEWKPDLVLREPAEIGSYVAAQRAGVPVVNVAIGLRVIEERLANAVELERYGATADGLLTARTLSLVPPSIEPGVDSRERYRDPGMAVDRSPGDDAPLVYVTFGSVAANIGFFPGVYRAALDALADLDARVLMTLGEGADPQALGPLPANATVERWVPQADVLREARAVVSHGGFGTTYGALAAGVPVAVLPLFSSDQFDNAAAIQASGGGVAVERPEDLTGAVTTLLRDGEARTHAERIAAEMASLPDPEGWLA